MNQWPYVSTIQIIMARGKMILNPEKIANTAKVARIDPKIVSKNLLYPNCIQLTTSTTNSKRNCSFD